MTNLREFWVCPSESKYQDKYHGLVYPCVKWKPINPHYILVREVVDEVKIKGTHK